MTENQSYAGLLIIYGTCMAIALGIYAAATVWSKRQLAESLRSMAQSGEDARIAQARLWQASAPPAQAD
jgi:hypothetical protein